MNKNRTTASLSAIHNHSAPVPDTQPSVEHLSDILTSLPAAVLVLDTSGQIIQVNKAANTLLAHNFPRPLEGLYWRDVIDSQFIHQPDDGHEVSTIDGRRVNISTCPLGSGSGQIVLIKDITETRNLQGQLARHERLSALGEMAATLAHQFRTPLSTAMLYASQLGGASLDDSNRKRFSDTLCERLGHLEVMVQDMLTFVRGGDSRPAQTVNIDDMIHDAVTDMESRFKEQNICFKYLGTSTQSEVFCNRTALTNAIQALLDNAVDACTRATKRSARISLQCIPVHHQTLKISISDNGDGIHDDVAKRMFEPFFSTHSDGTGLGLPMVFGVAKAHGGRIDVDTHPGRGTTMSLLLPTHTSIRQSLRTRPVSVSPPSGPGTASIVQTRNSNLACATAN